VIQKDGNEHALAGMDSCCPVSVKYILVFRLSNSGTIQRTLISSFMVGTDHFGGHTHTSYSGNISNQIGSNLWP
jgi:hypothetical protein